MERSDVLTLSNTADIHRKENVDPDIDLDNSLSFSGAIVSTQNPENKNKATNVSTTFEDSSSSLHDSGVKMTPSESSFQDTETSTSSYTEPVMNERQNRRKHLSDYTNDEMDDTASECFKVPNTKSVIEANLSCATQVCSASESTTQKEKKKRAVMYDVNETDSSGISKMFNASEMKPNEKKPKRKGLLDYTTEAFDNISDCFELKDKSTKERPKRKPISDYTNEIDDTISDECFKVPSEVKKEKFKKRRGIFDCTNNVSNNVSDCFNIEAPEPEEEKVKRKRVLDFMSKSVNNFSNVFDLKDTQVDEETVKHKRICNYTTETDDNMTICFKNETLLEKSINREPTVTNQTYSIVCQSLDIEGTDKTTFSEASTSPSVGKLRNETYTIPAEKSSSVSTLESSQTESRKSTDIDSNDTLVPSDEQTHFTYEISLEKESTTTSQNQSQNITNVDSEMDITLTPINSINETNQITKSIDSGLNSIPHLTGVNSIFDTTGTNSIHDAADVISFHDTHQENKSSTCPVISINEPTQATKSNDGADNSINDADQANKSNTCSVTSVKQTIETTESNDGADNTVRETEHSIQKDLTRNICDSSYSIVRDSVFVDSGKGLMSLINSRTLSAKESDTLAAEISECILGASAAASNYSVVVIGMDELTLPDFNKSEPIALNTLKELPLKILPVVTYEEKPKKADSELIPSASLEENSSKKGPDFDLPAVSVVNKNASKEGHDLDISVSISEKNLPKGADVDPIFSVTSEENRSKERSDSDLTPVPVVEENFQNAPKKQSHLEVTPFAISVENPPKEASYLGPIPLLTNSKKNLPIEGSDSNLSTIPIVKEDLKKDSPKQGPQPEGTMMLTSEEDTLEGAADPQIILSASNAEERVSDNQSNEEAAIVRPIVIAETGNSSCPVTPQVLPPPPEFAEGALCNITSTVLPPPATFANTILHFSVTESAQPKTPGKNIPAVSASSEVLPFTPAINVSTGSNVLKTPDTGRATSQSSNSQTRRSLRNRSNSKKSIITDSEPNTSSGRTSSSSRQKRSFESALSNYSLRSRPSSSPEITNTNTGLISKGSTTMFSMSKIGRVPVSEESLTPVASPPPKKKKTRVVKDDSLILKNLPSKPNFPKFDFYCNQRFYKYLVGKMEPKYGIMTNVKVVELARYINNIVRECVAMRDGYQENVSNLKITLRKKGVVVTPYDFYVFCFDYLPPMFRKKAVPMLPSCGDPPNIEMDVNPWEPIEV